MKPENGYVKHVDLIAKAEFLRIFTEVEALEDWFTEGELQAFTFPRNAGSLGARYLIKKRICEQVGVNDMRKEIEILNDAYGKPQMSYQDNLSDAIESAGIRNIMCSISHSRNYITGMIIFCF